MHAHTIHIITQCNQIMNSKNIKRSFMPQNLLSKRVVTPRAASPARNLLRPQKVAPPLANPAYAHA